MNSFLYIKFEGYSAQNIIQKLALINVNVYNIELKDNYIYVKILSKDYNKIHKYLKTLNPNKVKYTGLEYLKKILKQYRILFIATLISIIFVWLCSNLIVDIKIVHEDEDLVKIVKKELENYGIKKFSFYNYKYLQKVKKEIKNKHLDIIDWFEINKKGMTYIVRIEERIINKPEIKPDYCGVYATKDGLIKKIKVFSGESVVEINDYIKSGDLLVSGDIKLNDNVVSQVCAQANIYAEVWYVVNLKIPLHYTENQKTGKVRNNFIFNYDEIDYQLFKNRVETYEEKRTLVFDLFGVKIYLKKEIEYQMIEVIKKNKMYTIEEAVTKAQQMAKEKIKLKIKNKGKIIEQKILQKSVNDSTMNIDIFIVVEEEISSQRESRKEMPNDV